MAKHPSLSTPAKPRPPEHVRSLVRRAGLPVAEVVFTDNRRVMASLAGGGTTLRLHRSFASAPDAVLRALAPLFAGRSKRERERARAAVRAFLAEQPRTPPVASARSITAADRPHLERLRAEFDRINREQFGGELPAVPLFLSGRMRRRNGHFRVRPLEIVIARRLCTDALPGEAEHTLRHEMIHLWQHVGGHAMGHGAEFRRWARALDVHPRATRPVRWVRG